MKKLLLIAFLALFLRTYLLNIFPVALADDEMDYVITARAIWLTGRDTGGAWSPLSLRAKTGTSSNPISELPSLITAPFAGLLAPSLASARLPYVIFSLGIWFMVYLISKRMLGEKTALAAAFVMAVNPWAIHFGRTAYESPLALFFYLSAFYWFIWGQKRKVLICCGLLFLGFFCYHGAKLLLVPFALAMIICRKLIVGKKAGGRESVQIGIFAGLLLIFFLYTLKFQSSASRINSLVIFNPQSFAENVNLYRRESLPAPWTPILVNKYSLMIGQIANRILQAFSTDYLFISGEDRAAFAFWYHGYFYIFESLLMVGGAVALFAKQRKVFWAMAVLLGAALVPAVLYAGKPSYVLRAGLMFPILMISAGKGLLEIYLWMANRAGKFLAGGAIAIVYLLAVGNFLYLYFYRYPIYAGEGFFLSHRIVAEYAKRASSGGDKVIVLAKNPLSFFEQYLYYSGLYNKNTAAEVAEEINDSRFGMGGVSFTNNCQDVIIQDKNITLIVDKDMDCGFDKKELAYGNPAEVRNQQDWGTIFEIYNDRYCARFASAEKRGYFANWSDYDFARLGDSQFCQRWI